MSDEGPVSELPAKGSEGEEPSGLAVTLKLPEGAGELSFQLVPFEDLDVTLRQLLAEHPQSCAFTSFRLQVVSDDDEPTYVTEAFDAAAHLAGLPEGEAPVLRLALVLDPYCLRTVRQHVRRFQDVLLRHPPVALPQVTHTPEPSSAAAAESKEKDTGEGSYGVAGSPLFSRTTWTSPPSADPIAAAGGMHIAIEMTDTALSESDLLGLLLLERARIADSSARYGAPALPVPVDLAGVYPVPVPGAPAAAPAGSPAAAGAASAPAPAPAATAAAAAAPPSALPVCLKSVTLSGYNPPPAPRLMQGDLLYLRIETLEGRALHVTATAAGFFVNRSTDDGAFDPAPAQPPLHSRTLWALLHRASQQFRAAYAALLLQAAQAAQEAAAAGGRGDALEGEGDLRGIGAMYGVVAVPSASSSVLAGPGASPFVHSADAAGAPGSTSSAVATSLFGMALAPTGAFALARVPWLVPPPALAPQRHTLDARRAEDALLCAFGMDDRGALRDWNEEWASVQELPVGTFQERLLRARARTRVLSDFVDAATQGAIAIVQGHVPPLNPSEPSRMHVCVGGGKEGGAAA